MKFIAKGAAVHAVADEDFSYHLGRRPRQVPDGRGGLMDDEADRLRPATAAEIRGWYERQGLTAPEEYAEPDKKGK